MSHKLPESVPKSHPNVSKKTLKLELNGAGGPKKTLKDRSKNKQHTYDPKVGKNEPKMNPQTRDKDPVSPQTPFRNASQRTESYAEALSVINQKSTFDPRGSPLESPGVPKATKMETKGAKMTPQGPQNGGFEGKKWSKKGHSDAPTRCSKMEVLESKSSPKKAIVHHTPTPS